MRTSSDLQRVKIEVGPQRFALAPQISQLAVSIRLLTPKFICFPSDTCEPYGSQRRVHDLTFTSCIAST